MKMISYTSLAIACSMTALAVGCAKGKKNGPDATPQADIKYQYNIKDPQCAAKETGAHIETSLEKYCILLKDEAANQNCGAEERESRYNSQCVKKSEQKDPKDDTKTPEVSDDTGNREDVAGGNTASTATTTTTTTTLSKVDAGADETAFNDSKEVAKPEPTAKTDQNAVKIEDLSGLFRLRPMSNTDVLREEIIKAIPTKKAGDLSRISLKTSVSCVKDVEAAIRNKSNGVILFGKSKMVFNQDENATNTKSRELSTRLATLVSCLGMTTIQNANLLTAKIANSETYETRNLKLGESIIETMMTSTEGEGRRSAVILVSCVKDHAASAISGKNGIQLLAGATLLLNRDQVLSNLKNLNHDKESVVVTCGLQSN